MPSKPPSFRPAYARDREADERARKARLDAARPTPEARGYDADWRAFRSEVLAEQPFCETCGSTDRLNVDHRHPIATHPHLRLVRSNVRVLCQSCHSSRTARDQGFARRARDAEAGAPTRPRPPSIETNHSPLPPPRVPPGA
jgi:5-methylcytosine-specific restriction protein A